MGNRRRWIQWIVLLIVSAALAFGMEALQIATQPKEYTGTQVIQEAGIFDPEQCELTNAEVKKGTLSTKGEGAEILYDFGQDTEIPMLHFWSKKHQKSDVPVKVYWAKDGADFTEENSVSFTAVKGKIFWDAGVPAGSYRRFRILIDGKMTLKSIEYREAVEERIWIRESLQIRRVLILIPVIFLILLGLSALHAGRRLAGVFVRAWKGLSADWKSTGIHAVTFLAVGAAAFFLAKLFFPGGFGAEMTVPRTCFCLAAGLSAGCLATFRKTLGAKPENLFLVICLSAGILMVFTHNILVGWDEGYHYNQATLYSYLGSERRTAVENTFLLAQHDIDPEGEYRNAETRPEWIARQQEMYERGAENVEQNAMESKNLFEVIPGFGLYLSRALGLKSVWQFMTGKLFGLLAYALCGYFAIRKLKSGKMIAAAVMLIPCAVFIASTYSYDTSLNAFCTLGLAYWFAAWQEPEKKLTWGEAGIMLGSILFGCLAKAVYFPMAALPLMLPAGKFRRKGEHEGISRGWAAALCVLAAAVLVATFAVPILQGNSEADTRGGEAETYGQMDVILGDIPGYLGLLFRTLGTLLNPAHGPDLLSQMGYVGMTPYGTLLMILLIAVAFTDKKTCDRRLERNIPVRLISLVLMFGVTCLICTAMYIQFTPVGSDSIDGIQLRYLMPFIFPVLMLLGSGFLGEALKIDRPWKQQAYNGIVFAVTGFILFCGVYVSAISRFVS